MSALRERDAGYEGWRVSAASSVGVFVGFSSVFVYTFGIFLRPMADEFGWSREAVSVAFGIAAMALAVCSPLLGRALDRGRPRRVIVPSLLVFGTAFASLALLTPNLWHLYLVCLAIGVVGNGTAQMAYSRAVSSWFTARRGVALSLVMAGGAVGAMLLPPLAQAMVDAVGWRTACAVLGVSAMAIGVPSAAALVRERPLLPLDTATQGGRGATVREGLRSRVFWLLVGVLFCASIAQNGAITHLSALLTDRGVPAGQAALALSAMGGASLVGRLVTGWLLDRFRAGHVSFVLLILAAAGALMLAQAHSLVAGLLAAALIGFGMGGEADVTPYVLAKYLGLRAFSTLYGLTWTAYAVAGAAGPILMGRAFDLTGSYTTLLTTLAAVTLASAGAMLLLPRDVHPSAA